MTGHEWSPRSSRADTCRDWLHCADPSRASAGDLRPRRRQAISSDTGYLNSLFAGLGLQRFSFLSYEHPVTMFLGVVLAETWRATSLVMVILVAGVRIAPKGD